MIWMNLIVTTNYITVIVRQFHCYSKAHTKQEKLSKNSIPSSPKMSEINLYSDELNN